MVSYFFRSASMCIGILTLLGCGGQQQNSSPFRAEHKARQDAIRGAANIEQLNRVYTTTSGTFLKERELFDAYMATKDTESLSKNLKQLIVHKYEEAKKKASFSEALLQPILDSNAHFPYVWYEDKLKSDRALFEKADTVLKPQNQLMQDITVLVSLIDWLKEQMPILFVDQIMNEKRDLVYFLR